MKPQNMIPGLLLIFTIWGPLHIIGATNHSDELDRAGLLIRTDPAAAVEIADRILKDEKSLSPEILFKALLIRGGGKMWANQSREALSDLLRCEQMIGDQKIDPVDIRFHQFMGMLYSRLSDYGKGLDYNVQFLARAQAAGNELQTGVAYNNIGLVYIYLGNYEKALANLYETRIIMKKLGKKDFEAKVLNNIGICLMELKNFEQAIQYTRESLKIKEELGDREGIGNALNNIGQNYFYMKKLDKALEYTRRAEKIAIDIQNKKRMATSFTNMGRIYMKTGEAGRAEKYLLDSLRLKEELEDHWETAFTLKILAELYKEEKKTAKSLEFGKRGLAISREIGSHKLTAEILQMISGIHAETGNYRKALNYYTGYKEMSDRILSEKSRSRIEELNISHEMDQKNDRIRFLEKENDLKNRDILSRKKIQRLFIALIILLLITAILIYLAYRTKLWANKKLRGMNRVLGERTEELEKAIQEVKTLTGLLPVCSSCKKVRDEEDRWKPMEEYIKEHSAASVTHSICPECREKMS